MTEGTTPAGWYDDGQGNLRWFDGTAWTEHVQPLPPATPPPPAAPEPAAPVAPVAAAPAAAAGAGMGAAAASHQYEEHPDLHEEVPIYRKPWFIAAAAIVIVIVLIGAFIALKGGSSDGTSPSTGGTPNGQVSTPATSAASVDPAAFGADPATIAAKAGCAVSATIPAAAATAGTGAQPKSKVACTLNGTTYTVVTWNSATDQNATGSLGNAFTQPVAAGTKYYATADGWTAFDTDYSQAGAQAFATPAGGTAKGVVVVLGSTPAP